MELNLLITILIIPSALSTAAVVTAAAVRALNRRPARPRQTNRNIAVLEDTLANLSQAREIIAAGQEIATAARQGRYRGDVLEAVSTLLIEAEQCNRRAAYVAGEGRKGEYHPATTERDLDETSRKTR